MSDTAPSQSRFLVRMGGNGWMVYDRERKGPAAIGFDLAADLSKERAEQVHRFLTKPEARSCG